MTTKQKLKEFFYRLWNFRKIRRFRGYEKKLSKAISDKEVDQIILKHKIVKYMAKYLGINARSEYIPKDFKSKEESRQQVIGRFGEEMEQLDIFINDNLELCTR